MKLALALARARGMARSLAVYYGQVWRRGRLERFYGQFLTPGALAFDVGAHVGNRIRAFRHLGARVVAVEPQPDFVRLLGRLYGRDPQVVIEPVGVGAAPGAGTLLVSTLTPTVSTFAGDWIREVQADPRFGAIAWDRRVEVPMVTLEELIRRHGEPAFCKIDVEGLELDVLRGLERPLRAVSFEYIPIAWARAAECVDRLQALGDYRYRHSKVETMRWASSAWLDARAMKAALAALRPDDGSGDVYAVRADQLGGIADR